MSPELADLSLLELFAMELTTHRQAIEDGLVGLESDRAPERLEPLMRAAHSIKGAARIVNLDQAVGLAHAMEDMFQAAQKGSLALSSAHVDALLQANDFFGRLGAASPSEMPALLEASAGEATRLEEALCGLMASQPDVRPAASLAPETAAAPPGPVPQGHPIPVRPGPPERIATASPGSIPAPPAPVPAPPSQAPPHEARQEGVVRLSADRLGKLMGLAGQCLVEAGALGRIFDRLRTVRRDFHDLTDILTSLRVSLTGTEASVQAKSALDLLKAMQGTHAEVTRGMDQLTRRMETLSDRLYTQVLGSRMRPFGEGAKALPRMVRDLSRELGKQALFVLDGSNTSVDRDILDKLEAPLIHLARNAVDHGLEYPEERARLGKAEQGRITLRVRHVAGTLEVRLSDDGRGMALGDLREAVVRKRLAPQDLVERMSEAELFDFLFLPGFTTAQSLTQVSGRGVGLDAVKTMVQEVGGHVRVESAPGEGTAFILRLPVSRSVVRALVVMVGGEPYALPLSRIGKVVTAEPGDILSIEGRQYLRQDGANIGLAPASQILGRPGAAPAGEELPVVVLEGETGRFGLAVEAFLGERDLVVHPLDARLGKVPGVAAASILEDGSPVLILDDADLTRSLDELLAEGRLSRIKAGQAHGEAKGPKKVLVVDDSLTVREVERQLLAGRGYQAVTAVDGMEGLALAGLGGFDLIITDVDMPRMTGIELTRRIKADPALVRTPVMIVSYKDRPEDRLAGLEAGADYYLAKSGFRDEALLDAVRDLIGEP